MPRKQPLKISEKSLHPVHNQWFADEKHAQFRANVKKHYFDALRELYICPTITMSYAHLTCFAFLPFAQVRQKTLSRNR
jgi:hypothetical protein